jgi:hypothetical protein
MAGNDHDGGRRRAVSFEAFEAPNRQPEAGPGRFGATSTGCYAVLNPKVLVQNM